MKVFPSDEIDAVAIEVPADWRGLEVSPPELVEGVQPGAATDGFWHATAAQLTGGLRAPVVVRLAAGQKQPFDLVLTAVFPVEPGHTPPSSHFRDSRRVREGGAVTATVPDGLEVRGEMRSWDAELALGATRWHPFRRGRQAAAGGTGVTAKTESGLARVLLGWHTHRPDLVAEIRGGGAG